MATTQPLGTLAMLRALQNFEDRRNPPVGAYLDGSRVSFAAGSRAIARIIAFQRPQPSWLPAQPSWGLADESIPPAWAAWPPRLRPESYKDRTRSPWTSSRPVTVSGLMAGHSRTPQACSRPCQVADRIARFSDASVVPRQSVAMPSRALQQSISRRHPWCRDVCRSAPPKRVP